MYIKMAEVGFLEIKNKKTKTKQPIIPVVDF